MTIYDETTTMPMRPISDSYWVIPGQFLAGEYPGNPYNEEETRQRVDAFLEIGFDTFIDLTTEGELTPYNPILLEQAQAYDIAPHYQRFGIGDFGLPTVEQMQSILDAIDEALSSGRKIYIHCWGGIGRTGTTIGCFLVRHGIANAHALMQLATWWHSVPKAERFPNSPETYEQVNFISHWQKGM